MFKKSLSALVLSTFVASTISACGSNATMPMLDQTQVVAQDPDLQVLSFTGVMKEIKNASSLSFKELDKNADKMIDPSEYGVGTPDSAKAYYAIDDNHDGKITLKEFMPGFFKKIHLTFRLQSAARALFTQLDKGKKRLCN